MSSHETSWWVPAQALWRFYVAINTATWRALGTLCVFLESFPVVPLLLAAAWLLSEMGVW